MPFVPNHLSVLGIIHTAISILAIIAALIALALYGKLSPSKFFGQAYIWLTVLTCLTALPIMKTGHPTPGHFLAIIILVLIPIAIYANSIPLLKKIGPYVQIFLLSTTLFLSMIPTTVETLTRLPISHPIADGPNDPKIQTGLLIFVVLYVVGVTYQLFKLRRSKKKASGTTPDMAV